MCNGATPEYSCPVIRDAQGGIIDGQAVLDAIQSEWESCPTPRTGVALTPAELAAIIALSGCEIDGESLQMAKGMTLWGVPIVLVPSDAFSWTIHTQG
jgi:hypothetical protein